MTVAAGQAEVWLELLPATPMTRFAEHASERSGWLGLLLKLIDWCWFPAAVRKAAPA
jgi:hypothetical protein